jgi:hypothetical protein
MLSLPTRWWHNRQAVDGLESNNTAPWQFGQGRVSAAVPLPPAEDKISL